VLRFYFLKNNEKLSARSPNCRKLQCSVIQGGSDSIRQLLMIKNCLIESGPPCRDEKMALHSTSTLCKANMYCCPNKGKLSSNKDVPGILKLRRRHTCNLCNKRAETNAKTIFSRLILSPLRYKFLPRNSGLASRKLNSSVCIPIGQRPCLPEFDSEQRQQIFLFSVASTPSLESNEFSIQWIGASYFRGKAAGA
jgi:hypothetical protein